MILKDRIRDFFGFQMEINDKVVLFGIPNRNELIALDRINKIKLNTKYFIYKCKLSDTEVIFDNLIHYISHKCNIHL